MEASVNFVLARCQSYLRLMRFDRPIGFLLLLWPTLCALWIAGEGYPSHRIIFIFLMGVVIMRSAGCVINDIFDRDIDIHVARTKRRPLATGAITVKEAFAVLILLCVAALYLALLLNTFTVKLAIVGMALTVVYPLTKRFFVAPQLFLGIVFSWGIPMAYTAQTGQIEFSAWLLYFAAVIWAFAYDTLYSMADREDDKNLGIHSTGLLFGDSDRLAVAMLQAFMLLLLLLLGISQRYNFYYFVSLAIVGCQFAYQQYLIKDRDPQLCFKAFLQNNWVGLVLFLGFYLSLPIA